jgi:hypothetical protein
LTLPVVGVFDCGGDCFPVCWVAVVFHWHVRSRLAASRCFRSRLALDRHRSW